MLSKEQKQLYTIGLASQTGASRHTCLHVPYLTRLLSELIEYHRISSYFISYKFRYLYILIMVHSPVSNITGPPNWLQMFSVKWGLYYMVKDIFSGISKISFNCHLELLHYNNNNNINTHMSKSQYPQFWFVPFPEWGYWCLLFGICGQEKCLQTPTSKLNVKKQVLFQLLSKDL